MLFSPKEKGQVGIEIALIVAILVIAIIIVVGIVSLLCRFTHNNKC
jgi:uncharacterized protein (UPF0333 family)